MRKIIKAQNTTADLQLVFLEVIKYDLVKDI